MPCTTLPWTSPNPVLSGSWFCHTCPYPIPNIEPQSASPALNLPYHVLYWLILALYCLETWVRLRVYWWVDSSRIVFVWVMIWFKSMFSEDARVRSWIEAIPGNTSAVSWFDSFPGETTWLKIHYFNRINRHSAGPSFENVSWERLKSNQFQVSIHLRAESCVYSELMVFAWATSWF